MVGSSWNWTPKWVNGSSQDIFNMVEYLKETGFTPKVEDFQKLIPDCQDCRAWFVDKGKWSDGTQFDFASKVLKPGKTWSALDHH